MESRGLDTILASCYRIKRDLASLQSRVFFFSTAFEQFGRKARVDYDPNQQRLEQETPASI